MNFGDPRLPGRFWDKVHPEPMSGCWLWTGGLHDAGYGMFWSAGGMRRAHRMTYERLVAAPPPGLDLDHLCRTRSCCNPLHLEPVSRGENTRRGDAPVVASRVMRETNAKRRAKPTCRRGHALSGENLRILPTGARFCRACRKVRG